MSHRLLSIAVLTALALTGCGRSLPTASPKRTTAAGATQAKVLPVAPAGSAAAAAGEAAGLQLLTKVRQVLAASTGFSAELMSNTEGHWKQGERTTELRTVAQGFRLVWSKPSKFRAVVFNAPSALMEGATLVTMDGVNCTARAQGLLSIVPVHAKSNDPRIANARNHTFDRYCPNAQMARLTGASAKWTVVGTNGSLVQVKIDNVPRLDKEIDDERMVIDTASNQLKSMTAIVQGHTVVSYNFSKFSWNPKTTDDMFKL